MFKKIIYSNTLLTIRKGLKISIIEVFKGFVLIMVENIECKNSRIKLIKKELLLSIYHHTHQIRQESLRVSIKLYLGKLG